jgi:hypothetical protein
MELTRVSRWHLLRPAQQGRRGRGLGKRQVANIWVTSPRLGLFAQSLPLARHHRYQPQIIQDQKQEKTTCHTGYFIAPIATNQGMAFDAQSRRGHPPLLYKYFKSGTVGCRQELAAGVEYPALISCFIQRLCTINFHHLFQ